MVYHVPPPAPVALEQIMAEHVDLYFRIPPPGENTPVSVYSFQVDELLPYGRRDRVGVEAT